jgi:hypothetical protein
MHGDLLYVFVITLEDKRFHITASTRGFYVNQTNEEEFNPRPAPSNHLSHSLVDLLNQVSIFAIFIKIISVLHFASIGRKHILTSVWFSANL